MHMQNLVAEAVGRSPRTIVVMAHRDNTGIGQGANDNASGTAMLVQLARAYGSPPGFPSGRLRPNHTIVFLSTDGGAYRRARGGLVRRALAEPPRRRRRDQPRLRRRSGRSTHPARRGHATHSVRDAAGDCRRPRRCPDGAAPTRPGALHQLVDLGFPFSLYEQAPFLAQGVGAITLTTAGDTPPDPTEDTRERLSTERLSQVGRSAQDLLGTLDEGLEFAQGTSSYLYLGSRLIRGWAVELVLIACLLPFLAAAVDLFARCRRRRIPLAPALRSLPQPARSSGSGSWGCSSSSHFSARCPDGRSAPARARGAPPRPTGRRSG